MRYDPAVFCFVMHGHCLPAKLQCGLYALLLVFVIKLVSGWEVDQLADMF
mgnify:CR=1 FL=1